MRNSLVVFTLLIFTLPASSFSQGISSRYQQSFLQLYQAVQQRFYDSATNFYKDIEEPEEKRKYSFLWPLCGLVQVNNESEKLGIANFTVDGAMGVIQKYYSSRPPAPGYDSYVVALGGGTRFYDDNQWIGLALMDAWFRNRRRDYLEKSKEIYRFMMTGYDTAAGGGLYWEEGNMKTKNTCSNGPGIILALQLYKATKEKTYLDTALLLYHWVNKYLQDTDNLYFDNISIPGGKIEKTKFSYNTGTMLQANVYLYELTNEKIYLDKAVAIAGSSLPYFYGKGKFRDGYWFNAVLLRAYQHLRKHVADDKYLDAFKQCTNEALANNINNAGLMGKEKMLTLVNQAGMLEILASLAYDSQRSK
ncbi:glycoside hydrolase family 76 protein [Foetidibacter luteolus]|uniref:glycoside hydrolase family 76 protein n=1 Tax=Foetidibacter luteolus TaxID=2608880 RepID=UPI00129B61BB|nr:glycoside hydrolase family 76 protein [Foetidibacter luteolus]